MVALTWDSQVDLKFSYTFFKWDTIVFRIFVDCLRWRTEISNHQVFGCFTVFLIYAASFLLSFYHAVLDAATKGNRYINSCLRYLLMRTFSISWFKRYHSLNIAIFKGSCLRRKHIFYCLCPFLKLMRGYLLGYFFNCLSCDKSCFSQCCNDLGKFLIWASELNYSY